MIRLVTIILLVALTACPAAVPGPNLEYRLPQLAPDEMLWVNITLNEQLDPAIIQRIQADLPRDLARATIVDLMKSFAAEEQTGLMELLRAREAEGRVEMIQPFWLTNFIACRAERGVIEELLAHPDVARLETGSDRPDQFVGLGPQGDATAWGVNKVAAPLVWEHYDYHGSEVIVAVTDTGVNYLHHDLRDHIWFNPDEIPNNGNDDDGNGYIDDYYGFYFDGLGGGHGDPMDTNGHGTHCAGTVASTGAAGINCGVAPRSRIMSLRVWMYAEHQGEVSVWESWQYALDMGAHISSNSIGWQYAWNPDRATWRANAEAAIAAGMVIVVAAGNSGPGRSTITCPGDVPGVITVGATREDDVIAGFSSRGPVSWLDIEPYDDYHNLIKPDLSAPGVEVTSCDYQKVDGYVWLGMSGTSMACPHVAGAAALLLEVNPDLNHAQIKMALEQYARDLGTPGKNNDYGAGRLNAFATVSGYVSDPVLYLTFDGYDYDDSSQGNGDGLIDPGEIIEIYCDVYNGSLVTANNVTARLDSDSDWVTIIDIADDLGNLAPMETGSARFRVKIDEDCPEPAGLGFTVTFTAANPYELEGDFELFVPGYGMREDCEFGIERLWRYESVSINTWAVNDEKAHGGQHSFSPNNPGGGYENDLNCSLVSLPFRVDAEHNIFTAWVNYDLEVARDMFRIEIRPYGSDTWISLVTITGSNPAWTRRTAELTPYEGMVVQLRLHFRTNESVSYEGLWIDDIYVLDYEVSIDEALLSAVACEDGVLLSWEVVGDFTGLSIYRHGESTTKPGARRPLNERPLSGTRGAFLDRDYAEAYIFEFTDINGNLQRLGPVYTTGVPSSPGRTVLELPYPNPSRGTLNVEFELSRSDAAEPVLLAVYDLAGRRVLTLEAGTFTQGRHRLSRDISELQAGVYLLRLQTAEGSLLRRVALVR